MHSRNHLTACSILIGLSLLLAACAPAAKTPTAATLPPPEATAVPPTPTVTLPPPRMLSICLGQEPSTLYPLGSPARSTWSVLEAVYDGPFDTRKFSVQPVILQKMPSIADGDAVIQPVAVQAGQTVVAADGKLVTLAAGLSVRPGGCSDPGCAVTWDGSAPLQMDRLSLNFTLRPGLNWSDNTPIKASDSVYAFNVASDPDTPSSKGLVDRTASYQAVDDLTVQWSGVPGYLPYHFETLYWMPLPEHAWKNLKAKDLLTSAEVTQKPLGWGPYVIQEWVKGNHITLKKNPLYFRASEGLPHFDTLVFRFLGEPFDNNLAGLLSGECDLIDQTTLLEEQIEPVLEAERAKKLKVYVGQGSEWEQVSFGIKPATYDDGYSYWASDRPNFFGDVRTRQAFAACMDRAEILRKPLENQTTIPVGFFPPGHPYYLDQKPVAFDPQVGKKLLDEVGWRIVDSNPAGPRKASGIKDIMDGTPLVVNYVTTEAPLRVLVAQRLKASLAQCGIQLNVQSMNTGLMYAPGDQGGPLFGRAFDLAEFAWDSSPEPPCPLFETSQIPNVGNHWLGVNITGYSNPMFDATCQAVLQARPGATDVYSQRLGELQKLYAQELPVIPLYFRMKIAASRPDFCGLEMDVSARTALWNIEAFDYGSGCK